MTEHVSEYRRLRKIETNLRNLGYGICGIGLVVATITTFYDRSSEAVFIAGAALAGSALAAEGADRMRERARGIQGGPIERNDVMKTPRN